VACGRGEPTAEDCAIKHWCEALKKFNARRERNGQWRADCPVPGCKSKRAIEFDAPAQHVRWKTFCGYHPKEVVRPYLAALIGPCMPGGSRRKPVKHGDLIRLALADIPPMTKNLRMLQMAGIETAEALDMLGVRRANRARVIAGKTGGASKRTQNPHPDG
jgi:hypothetical protein